MKKILITSGDPNGIGLEVSCKALEKQGPHKKTHFFLFRSNESEVSQLKRLDKKFHRLTFSSLDEALGYSAKSTRVLFDICSSEKAPVWVEQAAFACHRGFASGLVTAPLSKTLIQRCGYKAKGHTEILQAVSGSKEVFMVFIGEKFNVLLVTGHVPLSKVSKYLSSKKLVSALNSAFKLRKILPVSKKRKPVALLGLNPHSGESGLLGKEELLLYKPLLVRRPQVVGPLVPDAAFLPKNWPLYSVYVCPYHDQGLIPFKMVHGTSGFHLTFGLSFIRTSVDHGTAFDIFGKNKADSTSMQEAISACIEMVG